MKIFTITFLATSAFCVGLALQTSAETTANKEVGPWRAKMTDLSTALGHLIPELLVDPSPGSQDALKAKVEKVYALTRDLDQSSAHAVKAPDADPSLAFISRIFREDIERAKQSLSEGRFEYARDVLRSSVSYCIACHTRTEAGTNFPVVRAFEEPLKKVPWLEKIYIQAATRQFDPVFNSVMEQLKKDHSLDIKPFDLERGVRVALAVAIRVKESPDQALLLADQVSRSSQASTRMKEDAQLWKKDLKQWQMEGERKYKTDEDLILAARRLIDNEQEKDQWEFKTEIRYLRASMLMHRLLRDFPKSSYAAEALYLVGLSYEMLQDLGLWSLHEMYFQTCIHKAAHTPLAMKCYNHYKDSVALGYSGSRGTDIPAAVSQHLQRMKTLAEANTTKSTESKKKKK